MVDKPDVFDPIPISSKDTAAQKAVKRRLNKKRKAEWDLKHKK